MKTFRPYISKVIKRQVLEKYDYHCAYCGSNIDQENTACLDHIVPIYQGGSSEIENLNPACHTCNNWKTTFSLEHFRREMSKQVERAREYSRNFRMAERFGLIQEIKKPVLFYFERISNA